MEQNYKIAIIGLGYVGLPLALSFGKYYTTIGYDINVETVNHLNSKYNNESSILFTNKKSDISTANIYIVTVPTPVYDNNLPDLSFLESATKCDNEIISGISQHIFSSIIK